MALTDADQDKVTTLLGFLGLPHGAISFAEDEGVIHIEVTVSETEAGRYIGRGASVLDSLQLLLSLLLRHGGSEKHILLDIGGYRLRRRASLIELAKRLGDQAESTGTPQAFPPLSSTERRELHLLYSADDTLTTFSEGEGYDRRLYITKKSE